MAHNTAQHPDTNHQIQQDTNETKVNTDQTNEKILSEFIRTPYDVKLKLLTECNTGTTPKLSSGLTITIQLKKYNNYNRQYRHTS